MLVAELTGVRRFRLFEQEPDEPGPGEVQVRVEAVGICGSDMHSYLEGSVGDTPCVYPMVLGHEPAGVVVKTGAGVTGWQPGDRAAFEPALYCYHCEFCMSGRHNICANLRFMSMPGAPGFVREFATLPARNLLALPVNASAAEGTLIEPLAVALHSMQFADVRPGETAAVFGCGPIGLLTIAALKLSGARRIWAIEPLDWRRDLALHMGATAAIDPEDVDAVREILSESKGRGVDVAIDCAAKGNTANQCIQVSRNGGRVVYTGIPVEVEVPLEFHAWRRKELTLFQVRRSNHESEAARDLLATHLKWFAPLITHQRPLSEIAEAFEQVEHYGGEVAKLVVG